MPSRWRIEFDEPMELGDPAIAEDRAKVFELAEDVRQRIQRKVYDNLVEREGAFR